MTDRKEDEPGTQRTTFKVTDKRIFAGDGNAAADSDSDKTPDVPPPAAGSSEGSNTAKEPRETALPPVDFQTFVISLGSSALMHLGALEHPETGRPEVNLTLAKHTIDVLSMLEKKTQGNLSAAESHLLTGLLYDLRLKYVEAARK